jgi:hypothetical protein
MRLGYDRNQIRRKVSITGTSGHRFRKQADIVVYIGERPALVVETKRIQHRLSEEDVNQALSYAQLLEPSTPIAVLTNGRDWEIYYFGGVSDVEDDVDQDGYNNLCEYIAGTNPNNKNSYPQS